MATTIHRQFSLVFIARNGKETEVFSSGFAFFICPNGHETVQYFVNNVNVVRQCPECDEAAILDKTEKNRIGK